MKNKTLGLITIITSLILLIFSLVLLILSIEFYDDGFGYDISLDSDYVVYAMCSISLLIFGICRLKNIYIKQSYIYCLGIIGVLLVFYNIGVFIKMLIKENTFYDSQIYLYIGLFGLLYFIFILIKYKKWSK